jgi:5'-deoxynucleotidase YfbR-like HD superfamily hydrolase
LSDFVDKIYTLKALTRYNNKFKIISESVAEHSFFVAVMTLKLHDDYNFNLEKALKMALIHDIPELHLSDVTHDVKRNFPQLAEEVTKAE